MGRAILTGYIYTKGTHAKLPVNATNLSKSSLPPQLMMAVTITRQNRKTFFSHLTLLLYLPDLTNRPFSMIRMAGNNWRGVDKRMASEYRNWTLDLRSQHKKRLEGKRRGME